MDELIGVAKKLGIEIRVEPIRIPNRSFGGLCRLRGRQILVLDQKSSFADRAGTLAEALTQFESQLEGFYLTPEARRLVDAARTRAEFAVARELKAAAGAPRLPNVPILARPKPGMRKARR